MDWSAPTLWWLLAGVLVAAELATGTFFLLMLALGAAAGALAAHAGGATVAQLLAAAVVGGGAVATWYRRRQARAADRPQAAANRDLNLDVGEPVSVAAWQPDGSTVVHHRGAAWQARWAGAGTPQPGPHVIRAVDGTRLLLDRPPPGPA